MLGIIRHIDGRYNPFRRIKSTPRSGELWQTNLKTIALPQGTYMYLVISREGHDLQKCWKVFAWVEVHVWAIEKKSQSDLIMCIHWLWICLWLEYGLLWMSHDAMSYCSVVHTQPLLWSWGIATCSLWSDWSWALWDQQLSLGLIPMSWLELEWQIESWDMAPMLLC